MTAVAAAARGLEQPNNTDWVAVARRFAPRIEASRGAVERDRRVPSDLIAAMVDAGLFHLTVPRIYGGQEVSYVARTPSTPPCVSRSVSALCLR